MKRTVMWAEIMMYMGRKENGGKITRHGSIQIHIEITRWRAEMMIGRKEYRGREWGREYWRHSDSHRDNTSVTPGGLRSGSCH